MTEGDVAAIQKGLAIKDVVDSAMRKELKRILEEPLARSTVELLATLVAAGTLELKFVVWTDAVGIFHDKVGIFGDLQENFVSFCGSINESWQGWHPRGNHETFEVFASWSPDARRVTDHRAYFEALWSGAEPGLTVHDPPDAFARDLLALAKSDPREALVVLAQTSGEGRRLFDFQEAALEDWVTKGRTGILRHATGSGKTVTALRAVREWLIDGKPALILVPSEVLLKQWRAESETDLHDLGASTLLVGGGHNDWRRDGLARIHTEREGGPRLTIATMQTACTDSFLSAVTPGDHLLVIADEVHRIGSPSHRRVLELESGGRLGLSATPERFGDPEGTSAIRSYFGGDLSPLFGLREAIAAGRLCPYEYFIHPVLLSDSEQEDWLELSGRIGPLMGQTDNERAQEQLKYLLIQRARIAKNAAAKGPTAADIVASRCRREQHWLVYCDSQKQLGEVRRLLGRRDIETLEYHSAMGGDPDATLARFRHYGGVLVAIRCLDEGVDIPEISHAVILASSRNPREFIQRRGRLLRTREGKGRAFIHDLLVIPPESDDGAFETLVMAEIGRATTFARDAINRGAAAYLDGLCVQRGIDPVEVALIGEEDDVEEMEDE
jgi:superfamily II DNA or RNA helicase